MMAPIRTAYRLATALLSRRGVDEAIVTQARIGAGAESVWRRLVFYEEVPGRPPWILRATLPYPIETAGDKTSVGAAVRCRYSTGSLEKRITAVEPPRLLQFDVTEQRLGIEGCIRARSGSYRLEAHGDSTHVTLVTSYSAYLRPRFFWRRLEAALGHRLHRHVLDGIAATDPLERSMARPGADSALPPGDRRGALV